MKTLIALLSLLLATSAQSFTTPELSCAGQVAAAVSVSPVGQAAIRRIDDTAPDLREVLEKVIEIQKAHYVTKDSEPGPQGFLISKWSMEDALRMMAGATLYVEERDGKLLGYAHVLPGSVFCKGLRADLDRIVTSAPPPDLAPIAYINQIGASEKRTGVGRRLLDRVKADNPRGVFAAILMQPFYNHASHDFFADAGFAIFGELEVSGFRELGDKRSHLVHWKAP